MLLCWPPLGPGFLAIHLAGSSEEVQTGWTSSEYGDEGSWWDTASIAERREFAGLFIDRMTVSRAAAKRSRPTRADWWGAINPRVEFDWAKAPSN